MYLPPILKSGFDDARCGFIVFLPKILKSNQRTYIEIETKSREVGYYTVPRIKLTGMAAIRRLLGSDRCPFR